MKIFTIVFFLSTVSSAFWFDSQESQLQQGLLLEFGQAPKLESKIETSFTLTSWNIYKGAAEGLYPDLLQMIEESDFVLMQEFLLNEVQNEQIQQLPHIHWALAKSFKDGGEWTGVATASKWQPYESVPVRSPGTQPFSSTPKMSLITKYKMQNGEEMWIVNVHGLNFDLTHSAFKAQIKALAAMVNSHEGPMIFAGDFNTWSDVRYEYLLNATASLQLERAPLENPLGIMSATLDHIFYRGFASVKPTLLDQVTSSDHNPMRLDFTLNQ